jgi:hypothetical protein
MVSGIINVYPDIIWFIIIEFEVIECIPLGPDVTRWY